MKHPVDVHVGKRIRHRRWTMGTTQQQLADAVGIKFQQIQKYETGANRVSASRLWDIATALQVPVSFFFEGMEGAEAGEAPVWGPVEFARGSEGALPPLNGTAPPTAFADDAYAWGVGEPADLIVFDPLFDPERTNWVFRLDADGYDTALPPPPPACAGAPSRGPGAPASPVW